MSDLVQSLLSILKVDQILHTQEDLLNVSASTLPEQHIPNVVVYPESATDVQNVVRLGNQLRFPIWYVSTGKNWGYGCRSAPYQGGVTMILERMNRILEVNETLGYAVLEPGVSYDDLNQYLKQNQSHLWADAAGSTKSASVLGNALTKGRGLTPYADHFGMLCGMEVVLPDGSLLKTSPSENYLSHHTYKWSVGPYVEGLFSQSNFGIVVKSGIWLMPKPEQYSFFSFEYQTNPNLFYEFIEDFRKLFFSGGLTSRPHLANAFAMLCIIDQYPKTEGLCLSTEALQAWKRKHGVQDWSFGGGLYGTSAQIKAQKKLVRKYLSRYGRIRFLNDFNSQSTWGQIYRKLVIFFAKLEGKSEELIRQISPAAELFQGRPTDDFVKQVYFKHTSRPTGQFTPALDKCGVIWTGPLIPFTGEHAEKSLQIAKQVCAEFEFDFFAELIVESPRTLIGLFGVFYDLANDSQVKRAQDWYKAIRERMDAAGYLSYRETSPTSKHAMDSNADLAQFLSKIKMAIDPNQVLAPTHYGISSSDWSEQIQGPPVIRIS